MKKWTGKIKRITAFVLMLVLMGTSMDMTVLAGGTVSGGDASMSVSTGDAQDSVSGGNAEDSTVSGGDAGFTEVRTEDELRTAVENGKSVKLMADISLTDTVIISDSLTVDLNGQSVTGAEDKSVFTVTGSGAEVIFTDSGADGTGMVTAVGDVDTPAAVWVENEASVIIEEGTYAGGYASLIVEEDGSATVNGGTFDGEDAYWAAVNFGGSLSISAGTFQMDGGYLIYAHSGTTKLTGGSFLTTDPGKYCFVAHYRGGTLDLSDFTKEGHRFYFENVPEENKISIPEGYAWFDGDMVDDEINQNDQLILAKPLKVTFNANGGSGTMAPVGVTEGEYSLPECEFTGPEGLGFLGWATTTDGTAMSGYYEVLGDITFYAIWGEVYDIYVGSVGMEDGDYLACGVTEPTKTQPATGGYAYYKDGVLTLDNYEYEGEGYWYDVSQDWSYSCVLFSEKALHVKLVGRNKLKNTANECDGIMMEGGLTVSGTGSLELDADNYGICCNTYFDEAIDDYVEGSLIIQSGTLSIDADDAINIGGNLTMDNGKLVVSAYYTAVEVQGDVKINNGTMELVSSDSDGLCCYGKITINNGSVYINADSEAMCAEEGITIAEDVVELIYPAGGSISYDQDISEYCIVDAKGNIATKVLIGSAVEHTWSKDYVYNHEAHWHICTDDDCFLAKDNSMYADVKDSAYGVHDTNGTDGVCSVCGYNTKKNVMVYVGNVGLANGEYLDNNGRISTVAPSAGDYAYYKDGVLTLKDFVYKGEGHEYEENDYVYSAAIYCELEELKLVLQGESQLTNTVGDGIYSTGDLSIEGAALLVNAEDDGIDVDGNLVVNSGTITIITQDDDGIDVDEESTITMNGGELTIKADDNGVDSAGDFVMNGGTLNITSDTDDCLDMEGNITIHDGIVTLKADDDGLDAVDILIKGGTITVEAGEYGVFAYSDLVLGEQVELQKPEKGAIDTREQEIDADGNVMYFKTIVDADGKIATYVVIKGPQSAVPTPTPMPGGTGTQSPAPTPGNSGATSAQGGVANGTYTSPKTGESPVMLWLISYMMLTATTGGVFLRKRRVNK